MNISLSQVDKLARRLDFHEQDASSQQRLRAFAGTVDFDSLSDRELKQLFEEFEHSFGFLGLVDKKIPEAFLDIGSYMNQDIHSVRETDSVTKAARTLQRKMISGLPVVNEVGRLVGIISSTDIVGIMTRPELRERWDEMTVAEVMTSYTITATLRSNLLEVLHHMMSFRLHRIIIVDDHDRPLGLISSLDATRALRDLLVQLQV